MSLNTHHLLCFLFLLRLAGIALCDPIPVVLWHGWGQRVSDLKPLASLLRATLGPDLYVLTLQFGSTEQEDVHRATYASMDDLVAEACGRVGSDPRLARGYNAMGISQGALFIRALVQRCPSPRVHNLVSIGGPQQGVYGLPWCPDTSSLKCILQRRFAGFIAYSPLLRHARVQLQYWHDPHAGADYREGSAFLADVNCEVAEKCNPEYKQRLTALESYALVKFTRDAEVIPKESEVSGRIGESRMNNSRHSSGLASTPTVSCRWIAG